MSRRLVVFGLSLSSAWGNGHATTYRGLCRELAQLGWEITFVERDVEWYRRNRDLLDPSYCELVFYDDRLPTAVADRVAAADAVLVGSYVPNGAAIVDWLADRGRPMLFYDIDTPITLSQLRTCGEVDYLRADQIPSFAAYLSFSGGPALDELRTRWHAQRAEALYCAVDPAAYARVDPDPRFACWFGYMGTYAADRQPALETLLIETARHHPTAEFLIAGAQYPELPLPGNVRRVEHVYPRDHAAFYSSGAATLNLTRAAMRAYGWSPASRLFEAAACEACIISDTWPGLDELFEPGREILLATSGAEVEGHLSTLTTARRAALGAAARQRVLREHTFAQRAAALDRLLQETLHP
jgi:spore maturation protein CgeB